jgi:glycosyltransferase involved in cell wall biosynthesis
MFYSVIVPSYNRQDELEALLPCLENQTFDKSGFEVILVDDGSTDKSEEFVLKFKQKTSLTIQFIKQENKGPGAARNNGMKNAKGDFIIFLDSDVILPNHWLESTDKGIKEMNLDAFGGSDKAHDSFSATLKSIDYAMTSFLTTGGIRGRKGKNLAKYFPRSFNMGLSKEVYNKIGAFGNLRHGQDIEYSNRIIKSGAKVGFIADSYVYHKRRTSLKKFFKQVFNWGVARINLYKIDKSMLEPLHCFPAIATILFFIVLLLSIFPNFFQNTAILLLSVALTVLILSAIHSVFKYRTVLTFFFVPITMFTQIIAYGIGFIYAFVRRILFGGNEFKGFSKNYYK